MNRIMLVIASVLFLSAAIDAQALEIRFLPKSKFLGIVLDGVLDEPDIPRLKQMVFQDRFSKPYVFFIDMRGGAQIAAQKMSDLLLSMAESHAKRHEGPMQVAVAGRCHSACTLLMTKLTKLADPQKLAITVSPEARFGLHGPRLRKKGVWLTADGTNARVYNHFRELAIRDYLDSGLNPDWTQYLEQPELKIFEPHEICNRESRIVPKSACVPTKREMSRLLVQRLRP